MLIQFGCTATILGWLGWAFAQDVVINELNLITGPNSGQFVELFGDEGTNLDDHSLVLLKSATSGGNFTPEVQAAIGLDGQSLDEDGFLLIQGSGWQNTVVAVVLAGSPVSEFPIGSTPTFSAVTDAVFFGSVGPTHPQMEVLIDLVAQERQQRCTKRTTLRTMSWRAQTDCPGCPTEGWRWTWGL